MVTMHLVEWQVQSLEHFEAMNQNRAKNGKDEYGISLLTCTRNRF